MGAVDEGFAAVHRGAFGACAVARARSETTRIAAYYTI